MTETVADSALYVYTIYDRPLDFPDAIVVRRWRVGLGDLHPDGELWCQAVDLASARQSIPPGLVCMDRSPDDDRSIVETWL